MKKIKKETSGILTYTPFENLAQLMKQAKDNKKEEKKNGTN